MGALNEVAGCYAPRRDRLVFGAVADGELSDPRTNSGVAKGVFEALCARNDVEIAFATSTRPTRLERLLIGVAAFRLPLSAWRRRIHQNRLSYILRSAKRDASVRRVRGEVDVVLHIRGIYRPAKVRYAAFVDTTRALSLSWKGWALRSRWLDKVERAYYQSAEWVFTAGRVAAESVVNDYGVEANKVIVVGGGTNYRPEETAARVPTKGPVRLLFVGLDAERKGLDVVLASFDLLRKRGLAVELTVVGASLTAPPEGVHAPGAVWDRRQLSNIYASHDIFCFPARHEPYGLVVQEAMAHGLPVVCSAVGSLGDIVEDGVTGFVVAELTAQRIAECLERLVSDSTLREKMGSRARERALSSYTWSAVVDRMVSSIQGGVYESGSR